MNQSSNYFYNNTVPLPNGTAVLVLGIISIVGSFCYGIVGLICGIIALVLAKKDSSLYHLNPQKFTQSSYNNLQAGKTCAIVGTILASIVIIFLLVYFTVFATFFYHVFQNSKHH